MISIELAEWELWDDFGFFLSLVFGFCEVLQMNIHLIMNVITKMNAIIAIIGIMMVLNIDDFNCASTVSEVLSLLYD